MKRRYLVLCACLVFGFAVPARAEAPEPHVVIAALQTAEYGAGGHDFALLYNPTDQDVDITGWKLQYRSAGADASANWTTKRTVACVDAADGCTVTLEAHTSVAVSTYDVAGVPNQPMASGFSSSGGQLRLVRPAVGSADPEVADMLGYGTAAVAEGDAPAKAPEPGQILMRKTDDSQKLVDTNVNADDFTVSCFDPPTSEQPLPALKACPETQKEGDNTPATGTTDETSDPPAGPVTYAALRITELLPDPASPAQDSTDEYIELYNATASAVDASGYTLQAGADFKYHYVLDGVVVPANSYVAVYSAESHLSLTNSGTSVRLSDPSGTVLDEVASYGTAKTGQAWALTASGWQWTTIPTPGAANQFVAPPPKAVAALATAVKKPAAAKKASATKVTTPKTTTPKTAKSSTAKTASVPPPQKPEANNALNYILLATVGLGAAGYGAYEYRHELSRFGGGVWRAVTRRKSAPAEEPTLQTD